MPVSTIPPAISVDCAVVTSEGASTAEDNLKAAIEDETREYTECYPEYARVARQEGFERYGSDPNEWWRDGEEAVQAILTHAPDLVFNTAEGTRGRFREAFYPALFDRLGLPFTGSDAWVICDRDGSDGERFPLSGEFVVIGRGTASGGDIAFEADRFLARQHARLAVEHGRGFAARGSPPERAERLPGRRIVRRGAVGVKGGESNAEC